MSSVDIAPQGEETLGVKRRRKERKREEVETGWTRCMFFVERKNRLCNIPRRSKDSLYCGHHDEEKESERCPCPVDPSHTIWRSVLEAHVLRCATAKFAKERREQPYFKEVINRGEASAEE